MSEGKKGRKVGRNKTTCAAYRANQRAEFNKARRLIRHLRKHPNTQACAWMALERLGGVLYQAQRSTLKLGAFLESKP